MSLDAQNLGQGDDIVTRKEDYQHLDGAAQCVFKQVSTDTDFWKARELTQDKLRKAAVEVGKSPSSKSQEFLARASTISVPPARPYFQ